MLPKRESDCWTEADRTRLLHEVQNWLWLYLGRGQVSSTGARAAITHLLNLSEIELRRLCAVHFLLSPAVSVAIEQAAPAALRAAERSTITQERGHGLLRGRPDWARTMKERASAGGDPSLYAYTTPRPELWRLQRLRALLQAVCDAAAMAESARRLRDPSAGEEQRLEPATTAEPSWQARCARLGEAAAGLLTHPRLARRGLGADAAEEPPRDRRPAPSWWPALAAACALHHDLLEEPNLASLVEVLSARIVEPPESDLLFEVWATLATLAALDAAGWQSQTLHLMGAGSVGPLACYTRPHVDDETQIVVYAQHTPRPWRRASRYVATFQRYGLAGSMRRPDMVIELQHGGQSHWLLIEVKRTIDPTYIADSLYKVLGYLADFGGVLDTSPTPHAVLLVWNLPHPMEDKTTEEGPVAVASATTYRDVLRRALKLDA